MKENLRSIYKIPSSLLKKNKWDLTLSTEECRKRCPEIMITMAESQLIRWIDELQGRENPAKKVREIRKKIKETRKLPKSKETNKIMAGLYEALDKLLFIPEYVSVIMDQIKDYERANEGFTVNGIKFRRLLGTNGGIKMSTIVYVAEDLYPEIKKRIDNGRDMTKELVPAKLEAYQALVCSASTPIPKPNGIIVVQDCLTCFKDNVILLDDSLEGEPRMEYVRDYAVEHNNSDGCGLMLPRYARHVNLQLNNLNSPITGMNTRYAWNKGMLFTFDYLSFARDVAGTYMIEDAWGHQRDVREADVILTTSMLKLWDSYESWEDYERNCEENHYQFAAPKICPEVLENERLTNYQFLQSYELSDDELDELCAPTVEELKEVLGMDWQKSILFMCGQEIREDRVRSLQYEPTALALMANPEMIRDPYIRKKIWSMISKKVNDAKKGCLKVRGNFAMLTGDPYALAQSMFRLPVTGLLKAGEIYHQYWTERGVNEVACFRAPMTCHNNIRKMKINHSDEAKYWYQYIRTGLIFNAWDTTCDAMNGCDFDGDTAMTTDCSVLLKNTLNSPTIVCLQRKAEKKIVTEEDIVTANILAFNDEIGAVTNHVTSMIERQAGFAPGTKEFEELAYRIMCGQNYQQNTIDRAKGIVAKSMPKYWYTTKPNRVQPEDDEQTVELKEFRSRIVAPRKPYFMTYIYPNLKSEYRSYLANTDTKIRFLYGDKGIYTFEDLLAYEPKTPAMTEFIHFYYKDLPVGNNACVVNRISWKFENEFDGYLSKKNKMAGFDYRIMKRNVPYSKKTFEKVAGIYNAYREEMKKFMMLKSQKALSKEEAGIQREAFLARYRRECILACSDQDELCEIMLDLCYVKQNSKQFAWDVCGNQIVRNLMANTGRMVYPVPDEDGSITFCGNTFRLKEIDTDNDNFE